MCKNAGSPLAYGSSIAIHAGIAAAEHHDVLALHVHEIGAVAFQPQFTIDIGNEIRQGLVHARQIFAVKAAFDIGVGAHAEKHCIEFRGELLEGNVAADIHIQPKFHTHVFHDFAGAFRPPLFQV